MRKGTDDGKGAAAHGFTVLVWCVLMVWCARGGGAVLGKTNKHASVLGVWEGGSGGIMIMRLRSHTRTTCQSHTQKRNEGGHARRGGNVRDPTPPLLFGVLVARIRRKRQKNTRT